MPNIERKSRRGIWGFLGNTNGNVTTMLALSILPLFFAAGSAIDYIRKVRAETHLQAAVDGAALAIATSGATTDSAKVAVGKTFLATNFRDSELADVVPQITVSAGVITVSADYDYPTRFMMLAGIKSLKIGGYSQVEGGSSGNAEIAMVLDYSLSMTKNSKYNLDASKVADATLKIGLVPFSAMVRTTMPASYVSQPASGSTWTGCTQDQKYPWNIGVAMPDGSSDSLWGYIEGGTENTGSRDCTAYKNDGLDIVPLTSDLSGLKAKLDKMLPVGNTNIPLGVQFGWNLLDPASPFTEGAPYADTTYKKFMIILTDGVQTSKQWAADGTRSVQAGNDNLVAVCGAARQKKITIFAIAYDITDPAVTNLLKQCAPGNYFEASTNGSEIDQVFDAITIRIKKSALRIAR
jgi:Flp pilus assembly protein TadG